MHEFILASQSPRRRELLAQAGYEFRIMPVEISENLNKNLSLDRAIQALAEDKAAAWENVYNHLKSQRILVLTADTMVVFRDVALGKPENSEQVGAFLRLLSGQVHQVKTALCLTDLEEGRRVSAVATSEVRFRGLSETEIGDYIASGEGLDKAGGYAIQGQAAKFVASLDGEWANVVGLPITLLERMLRENGWTVHRRKPIRG